jgi:hypothetical protein
MTRQDLNGKLYADVEQELGAELDAYVKQVNEIMDVDGLLALEQELMKEAQEYEEYLKTVVYKLPDDCEFKNQRYTRVQVAKFVVAALSRLEVEWQYTLGLDDLFDLWGNKDFVEISQGAFDSTLRLLNQLKYKGRTDIREILVVNAYLSQCHNEYSLDTAWNILISEKHNAIMDRVKLVQREHNVIDEQEVLMEE